MRSFRSLEWGEGKSDGPFSRPVWIQHSCIRAVHVKRTSWMDGLIVEELELPRANFAGLETSRARSRHREYKGCAIQYDHEAVVKLPLATSKVDTD